MADILDRIEVMRYLFHPRRDNRVAFSTRQVRLIDIPIGGETKNCGRLYPGKHHAPTVLFFHGNGEIAADYDGIAPLYTQIDVNLFVVDYRGYGRTPGKPLSSAMLSDAIAVFDALPEVLRQNSLAPGPLYVMGRSLGSAPAIETARYAGDCLAGLIIESGFANTFALLKRMGLRIKDVDEERHGFGNASKISAVKISTLIIHGAADDLIPPEDGRALFEHSGAADKRLVMVPGAGHNDLLAVGLEEYREALVTFIRKTN